MENRTADQEHITCNTQPGPSDASPSCGVCKLCVEETLEIGERFNRTPCTVHKELLSWIETNFEEEIDHLYKQGITHPRRMDPYSFGYYREAGGLPTIEYHDYKGRAQYSRELLISTPQDENQSCLHKRSLDPKWIDLQIARNWMDKCNENHGSKCSDPFEAPPCYPTYLIDTELNCIIQPGKVELEYVTLSYRWGEQDGFRTDRSSVESLKIREGLSPYFEKIPPTIHHAMHIVRSIGERYLWVDSICLVSDDTEHLAEQLQLMGLIYARAKLTIVATDGDAWDGIHGIRGAPGVPGKPRDLPNVFRWTDGTQITVRDQPSLSQVHGSASEYFQRGWTYQEYYLSQRRLILGKKQIHWSCTCASWHEDAPDIEQDPGQHTTQYFQIPNILNDKPDFEELGKLVFEYHTRSFTCPDDALPGFTGLLALLSRTFEGGFLCGHPETWFEASLMWHCSFDTLGGYQRETRLEPRRVAKRPSILPGAVLPSWSWIGWKGSQLQFLRDEEDFELPQWLSPAGSFSYITTPITTWYSHETPQSEKRRILSFPQQVPEVSRNLEDCFEGWVAEGYDPKRHQFNEVHESSLELVGKRVYHHPSLPNRYFWKPFPKRNVDQHSSVCIPKQHQYISCHTKRGWFYIKWCGEAMRTDVLGFHAQAELIDSLGQECGWLQIPPKDEVSLAINRRYHDPSNDECSPMYDSMFELVAVCRRRESCPCWPSTTCHEEGHYASKEFYGVLWIEWANGVAHRRSCGYVIKDMWDAYELDAVHLILG